MAQELLRLRTLLQLETGVGEAASNYSAVQKGTCVRVRVRVRCESAAVTASLRSVTTSRRQHIDANRKEIPPCLATAALRREESVGRFPLCCLRRALTCSSLPLAPPPAPPAPLFFLPRQSGRGQRCASLSREERTISLRVAGADRWHWAGGTATRRTPPT